MLMKQLFTCLLAALITGSAVSQALPVAQCSPQPAASYRSHQTDSLSQSLQLLVGAGVPGIVMSVISQKGYWESAAGWASIEQKQVMQTCHLQYLQSISKTYMATAMLRLYEQGKLNLDDPITGYLKPAHSASITNAAAITIRMLLQHTSGIADYNFAPAYVARLLQHPEHRFTPEEYLSYVHKKKADFPPGARYAYRNINYVLLALIADGITGNHAQYLREQIFEPQQLKHTFYRADTGYLHYPALTNTYWDRYSDGSIENVSDMQRGNVSDLIGDDGIVSTAHDAVYFLKALNEGKIIRDSTLQLMKQWTKDSKGKNRYGMGLSYYDNYGLVGYGHSGGGIGAGCELYYFPKQDIYVFIAINLGTVTDSPLHKKAEEYLARLHHQLVLD